MRVTRLTLRDFRSYATAEARLGPGLTLITGPNGVGKTNLLEAVYFGCTGRSCRTSSEREVVRFGANTARVEVTAEDEAGTHILSVGLEAGGVKRMRVDGVAVDRLVEVEGRPLVAVFLPDRLELVKGAPALRRAHLDQVVAALWPARGETRRAYGRALAQRNALLARVRAGAARTSLSAWDTELAGLGVALMDDRRTALEALAGRFGQLADRLGLGQATLAYRPRSKASSADGLAAELAERLESDLERGFTGHGPHRDEMVLAQDGRELRVYGSQGQQRLALLALLLAEREAVGEQRGAPPVMLLDDVMSELDAQRRERLVVMLRAGGQSVVTATDAGHVPGADGLDVTRLAIAPARSATGAPEAAVLQEARAA